MVSTVSEYRAKRSKIIEYLGGKCSKCGTNSSLQIDHINHNSKTFNISNNWSLSWDKLIIELDKCQLLCKSCHLNKSKQEGSLAKGWTNEPRPIHGKVSTYNKYKCRCDLCKSAKSEARRKEYLKYKDK